MAFKQLFISLLLIITIAINQASFGRVMEIVNVVGFSVIHKCPLTVKKLVITFTLSSAVPGAKTLTLTVTTRDPPGPIRATSTITATCQVSEKLATQYICETVALGDTANDYTITEATLASETGAAVNLSSTIILQFSYNPLGIVADSIQTTPQLIDYSESTKDFFSVKFLTLMHNQEIQIYAQKEAKKITLSKECSLDSKNQKILNCQSTSKATLPKGDYKITYSACPSAVRITPMESIIDLKVLDDNIIYDDEDKDENNSSLLSFSYLTSLALIYLFI